MKLLYKELALTTHPSSLVFALLGCLVIVPAYPYSAIFLFGCLAPYLTFVNARETNDLWYTALLPVSRRDSVRGKWLLTVFLQLFQLLFSLPFVLLRQALGVADNPVGLDATPAWYGLALAAYAAFDLVFFAAYFKSGYKAGKAFLLAALPLAAVMAAAESAAHIPALQWLDNASPENLRRQVPVLLSGMACYAALLPLAYKTGVRRFEKVDL